MTDDVLICQVPTCFKLATWKYFSEVGESVANSTTKNGSHAAQDVDEIAGRTEDVSKEPDSTLMGRIRPDDAHGAQEEAR
jgi:hypothetical protein